MEKLDKEDQASEDPQSDDSDLKMDVTVSEDSQDDKGDQSVQTSDTVTAKGDNAGVEENTIQDNVAYDWVKVKQERVDSDTDDATENISTDVHIVKVEQEVNEGMEEEDYDGIGNKDGENQDWNPEPSNIHNLCTVCTKVGECKYNMVRNGVMIDLCDDACFNQFHSSPTTYMKQAESAAQAHAQPDNQSNDKPASTSDSESVKSVQDKEGSFQQQSEVFITCTLCQLMNIRTSKPFLNWQRLDFCGEECLGKYQAGLGNNCSYCSGEILRDNKAKFCYRLGDEVKHFCSSICNNDFLNQTKFCMFCNKDLASVGKKVKDFCSQSCVQNFVEKNSKLVRILDVQKEQPATTVSKGNFTCALCRKDGPMKHEFLSDSKLNRLCSDLCLSSFILTLNTCDNCSINLNSENQAPKYAHFEDQQRKFCSFTCVNTYKNKNKKIVPCAWCANKQSNLDMIERVESNNKCQLFCTLNCLLLYKLNLQASSKQTVTCDQCGKLAPIQYHFTMSDGSVRSFCTYDCVMLFKTTFPAKQKVFVCSFCAKECQSRSGLYKHEKRHAGDAKLKCPQCGLIVFSRKDLEIHTARHSNDKPHVCTKCGKSFKTLKDLHDHIRLEESEAKFECTTCGSKYKKKSDLTEHVKKHTGEKSERCSTCGKCFRFKNNLRRHEKIHIKESQTRTSSM